jgi:hypothetical protein
MRMLDAGDSCQPEAGIALNAVCAVILSEPMILIRGAGRLMTARQVRMSIRSDTTQTTDQG